VFNEYSAGAVVFRQSDSELLFLVLRSTRGHWGSPKGHIQYPETIEETARREIREETGLDDVVFLNGFKTSIRYSFTSHRGEITKTVTFLAASTRTREVCLSHEHMDYAWLNYNDACNRITYEGEKNVLKEAYAFIVKKGSVRF